MIRTKGPHIWKALSSTAVRYLASAPPPKPFHYEELLGHDKKLEIPYKKLTGIVVVYFCLSQKYSIDIVSVYLKCRSIISIILLCLCNFHVTILIFA